MRCLHVSILPTMTVCALVGLLGKLLIPGL